MKLLHLDSSILGPASVSRQLSAAIVARFKSVHPHTAVTTRDLASDPIPHLSGAYLAAAQNSGGEHAPAIVADLAISRSVLEEFLQADVVVIGVALYNFGISSQLKAWVDRILIAGQTFRYGPNGPEGLAGNKKVYLAVARGGFYGGESPMASFEHAETYLKATLGFIGIHQPEVIVAEGLAVGPEQRQAAITAASERIAALHV